MDKEEFMVEIARGHDNDLAVMERLLPVLDQSRVELHTTNQLRIGTADSDVNVIGPWNPAEIELAKLHLDQAYWALTRAVGQAYHNKRRMQRIKLPEDEE